MPISVGLVFNASSLYQFLAPDLYERTRIIEKLNDGRGCLMWISGQSSRPNSETALFVSG